MADSTVDMGRFRTTTRILISPWVLVDVAVVLASFIDRALAISVTNS